MRAMKMLWGVAAAVALAVGCNSAPVEESQGNGSEDLSTPGNLSAMGDEDGDNGGCPPPPCPEECGHDGKKKRLCHHAPPDEEGSKTIELCLPEPAIEAHLREHDEDTLGCCPSKH